MPMSAMWDGIDERSARARRHNHALVALGRQVWNEDCTFETAIALICEMSAEALDVEYVNIWRCERDGKQLNCLHAYTRSADQHQPDGFDQSLPLHRDYIAQLNDVRVIDVADIAHDSGPATGDQFRAYFERHGIHSLLDAPVRSEGVLLGVVSFEHVEHPRVWTPEDRAFAASVGDYVAVAHEIARRREIENRLRYLERHDPHTDLPNRDHLLEVAHNALRPLHAHDTGLVVIHIHIDPSVGHVPGDGEAFHRFLRGVAERLRKLIGEQAALARVRGEGFAIIPHRHLREVEALELAERCLDTIEEGAIADRHPEFAAAATAGLAFSRDLAAPSADTLLRNAENASLRARSHGLGRCKVYNAVLHRSLLQRMKIEQTLRDAFEQNRLVLYYMPEVDLRDGRWRAAEALLRWRREDGAVVPAAEFIEAAESSGLIVRLGRWALQTACATAAGWPEVDGIAPMLRVNVSARQFEEAGLADDVQQALTESGLPAARLCLELTETLLLNEPGTAAKTLSRIRALGVHVALDDFGTGYCSLGYLKKLPIDTIKIDRGFTAGLPHDRADLAIVKALIALANSLDIDVVGEGVETEAQADCLRECGVVAVQGWLYSPAIDNEALVAGFGGGGRDA